MTTDILDRLDIAGIDLQDHQEEARQDVAAQVATGREVRLCLYHRTGAGKTIASLVCIAQAGAREVLVLAPPITHPTWRRWGLTLGVEVTAISHAKFRQKGFKIRRDQAMIVDEFHLLGGHTGQGWKKLDAMAKGLKAPLIVCSATPSYNDAERVYCVQHVLAPHDTKGGFLQFLYDNCETEVNPFGSTPIVTGFRRHADAEAYLASLPYVHYLEDEVIKTVTIGEAVIFDHVGLPDDFEEFGYDARAHRVMASLMEARHTEKKLRLLTTTGYLRKEVWDLMTQVAGNSSTPLLVFSNSSTIAAAIHDRAKFEDVPSRLITGGTKNYFKEQYVTDFIAGGVDLLIGTASLATGTDGIDKMCDTLLIVDDTDDASLRRQLMGRILPRGLDTDASGKIVQRVTFA